MMENARGVGGEDTSIVLSDSSYIHRSGIKPYVCRVNRRKETMCPGPLSPRSGHSFSSPGAGRAATALDKTTGLALHTYIGSAFNGVYYRPNWATTFAARGRGWLWHLIHWPWGRRTMHFFLRCFQFMARNPSYLLMLRLRLIPLECISGIQLLIDAVHPGYFKPYVYKTTFFCNQTRYGFWGVCIDRKSRVYGGFC